MALFTIADLHLSFEQNKPMNIFGENWEGHEKKIKENWIKKVRENDYVILAGDFSWATYLKNTKKDFEYLNELPGKKILLKGNHDYWWTTVKRMREFLKENQFQNIDFLYNNSFCIEDKIIVGTRGWNIADNEENKKMIKRENARLELSIKDGLNKYGHEKEIIAFLHYPPIAQSNMYKNSDFVNTLKKYNIERCYYGHLHGNSHKDAIVEKIDEIEYKLISADYLNFELVEI